MNPIKAVTSDSAIRIALTIAIWVIVLVILPSTPFMVYLESFASTPYLSFLNWFIPIGRCCTAMAVWWTAVIIYYGVSWILRQLGIVGL